MTRWIAVAALGLLVLGWFPTRNLAGPPGWVGQVAGIAVAGVASLLGWWVARTRVDQTDALPILMAMAVRLAVVAVLTVVGILSGLEPRTSFLVWVAVAYLAFLGVDVAWILRQRSRHEA